MRPRLVLGFVVATSLCSLPVWAQDSARAPQQTAPAEILDLPTNRDMSAVADAVKARQQDPTPIVLIDGQGGPMPQYPTPAIPAGRDAWVIEIVTSGGFTGATRRTVIDSSGSVTCHSSCEAKAPASALSLVSTSVKSAANVSWPGASSNDASMTRVRLCSDCPTTQFSLWQRGMDGNVRFFRAEWDSLSASAVDPAVRELHAQAMKAIQ
jgi:hypothetical protein